MTVRVEETGVPLEFIEKNDSKLRTGIVGNSGSGKTVLAASACEVPELSPVLIADCGSSSDSILGEQRFSNVKVVRTQTPEQIQALYKHLAPVEWGGDGAVEHYKTLVIDELDEQHTLFMRQTMERVVAEDSRRDIFVPSQREWGMAFNYTLQIVDWFRALPINLIFTFMPAIKEDSITAREQISIGLPGQLSEKIAKRLSQIIYLEIKSTTQVSGNRQVQTNIRVANFQPTAKFVAKTRGIERATRLGASMEDPTFAKIYALL